MSVAETINDILVDALQPVHLDVIDESHRHNVPADGESHFKLLIVSPSFDGQSLVQRHRSVNRLLAQQLAGPVHALGLHAYTEAEWLARGESVPKSPPCRSSQD